MSSYFLQPVFHELSILTVPKDPVEGHCAVKPCVDGGFGYEQPTNQARGAGRELYRQGILCFVPLEAQQLRLTWLGL